MKLFKTTAFLTLSSLSLHAKEGIDMQAVKQGVKKELDSAHQTFNSTLHKIGSVFTTDTADQAAKNAQRHLTIKEHPSYIEIIVYVPDVHNSDLITAVDLNNHLKIKVPQRHGKTTLNIDRTSITKTVEYHVEQKNNSKDTSYCNSSGYQKTHESLPKPVDIKKRSIEYKDNDYLYIKLDKSIKPAQVPATKAQPRIIPVTNK